jgi:hypothetical protein
LVNFPTLQRDAHAYYSFFYALLIRCLEIFSLYSLSILINIPSTRHLFSTVVLNMQRVSLLVRTVNTPFLQVMAILRRNVFMTEGHGKRDGDPGSSVWEKEQEEVMKLKDFNMDGGCQYIQ